MPRSYKNLWTNLLWQVNRRLRPSAVSAVVGLLVLLCIIQIGDANSSRYHLSQALALSVAPVPPDSQNPPVHKSKPAPRPVPIVGPWEGPVGPVIIRRGHLAPVFSKLPINEPVVFLGIDDGWYQSSENLQWLKAHHLPFSLFLVGSQVRNDYDYFRQLQAAGMSIEDHSVTHPDFTLLSLDDQHDQICATADKYAKVFGRRPVFFRPPYGSYNKLTRQAAAACGIKAIVNWHVVLQDGAIQYQNPATRLKSGDIILAHFQSDFIANMQALNAQLAKQHLQIARLESWLR